MGYSTLKWIEEEEEIKNSPDFWRAITQVEKDGNPLLHCHFFYEQKRLQPTDLCVIGWLGTKQ